MLDETDYDMDWSNYYTNWYSTENIYLRDILYQTSCGEIDFRGTYVSPSFLMTFLRGKWDEVRKLSGLETNIHPDQYITDLARVTNATKFR